MIRRLGHGVEFDGAKTNDVYAETLTLARRRVGGYTNSEEQHHKDRLMDALIVQTAAIHPADDPTRIILGKDGNPLSLDKKIDRVVKRCSTSLRTTVNAL